MTVEEVQASLLERGYDVGPDGADGDAGPQTVAALAAFQRAQGLVADGIAGPLTVAALGRAIAPALLKAEAAMPPWLALAEAEIGTVEDIGKGSNPKVIAYFRDSGFAGVKDDAVAWCAAFLGAMLARAGVRPSHSLAARSYETWGYGLKDPILGCVATKRRTVPGKPWQGHVGFVVGANGTTIYLVGGNQGDSVSIAGFRRSEFTAFRWASELPIPAGSALPKQIAGVRGATREA